MKMMMQRLHVARNERKQVLQTIIEFCAHQETLIIRAMAEVTTQG